MKKLIVIFTCIVMCISCMTGCGGLSEEEIKEIGANAISSLDSAMYDLYDAAEVINDCWYSGIKWGGRSDTTIKALADRNGISSSIADDVASQMGLSHSYVGGLSMDQCITAGVKFMKNDGTFDSALQNIESAGTEIKKLDNKSELYEQLSSYYSNVKAMESFLESPSGSYSTFAETINDYINSISQDKSAAELAM